MNIVHLLSHTGTVVPECFKGDSEIQWKNGKFDSPCGSNPPPQSIVTKIVMGYYVGDFYFCAKFGLNRIKVFCSSYMRSFPTKVTRLLFGGGEVLATLYRPDACTDFDAQHAKRHRFALRCAFWGSQNKYLRFDPIFPQNVDFGGIFDRTITKWAFTLLVSGENFPYLWSYAFGSWMLNRQINPSESKYVISSWLESKIHRDIAHAQTWIGKFNPKATAYQQ